jgi:hypothetical protein
LPVWKESPFFDEREKAALAWAESVTNIVQTHAGDAEYRTMKQFFSDLEIVELSISISLANFWNRMAGGFRRMPKLVNVEYPNLYLHKESQHHWSPHPEHHYLHCRIDNPYQRRR